MKNFFRILDKKQYELKDHLGNVRVAIGDMKIPTGARGLAPFVVDEKSVNDYYPYGMLISDRSWSSGSSRYGYNGKEMDNELKGTGNSLDFGERVYDPRTGRFPTQDKWKDKFANQSSYVYAGDSPIWAIDKNGEYKLIVNYIEKPNGSQEVLSVLTDKSIKKNSVVIYFIPIVSNIVEYVKWDGKGNIIAKSGNIELKNIGNTIYPGNRNLPDLPNGRPDFRYPAFSELDQAGREHDEAYFNKKAEGPLGMLLNLNVINADITLVEKSNDIISRFGQIDRISKNEIGLMEVSSAAAISIVFSIMVIQKAIRIGGETIIKEAISIGKETLNTISKLPNDPKSSVSKFNGELINQLNSLSNGMVP